MVRTYHGTDYDNNKCSYGRGYKKCPKKYTKYFEEINNLQRGVLNVEEYEEILKVISELN